MDEWPAIANAALTTLEALMPAIERLHRQKSELLKVLESVPLEGIWERGADVEWLGRVSALVERIREEDHALTEREMG